MSRTTHSFRQEFDRDPDGVWAAPGRVNLIGEHVDYAGGLCLPFALMQRTLVAASPRADDLLRLRSVNEPAGWDGRLDEIGPGHPPGWAGYAAGVPWALRNADHRVRGLDLLVGDSVPRGAGLASSAALGCAVALAVDGLCDLGLAENDVGRAALAEACRKAENDIAGAPTGGLDQTASLRCTAGHALLLDCLDGSARQLPFDPAAADLTLLVIDTQVTHDLAAGGYGQRRHEVDRAAANLGVRALRHAAEADLNELADPLLRRRARHVVTEIARVHRTAELLAAGRVDEIGTLLDASHASLAADFAVSCPELDAAVEAARSAGALGARMIGGGFGGSAIALARTDIADRVIAEIRAVFAAAGYPNPRMCTAVPSHGATRL